MLEAERSQTKVLNDRYDLLAREANEKNGTPSANVPKGVVDKRDERDTREHAG